MFKCGMGIKTGLHEVLAGLQFAVYKDDLELLILLSTSQVLELQAHTTIPSFMGAGYGTRTRALSRVGSAIALNLDFQPLEL